MALVTIELATPRELRGRWAAVAAIHAAEGWAGSCNADGPVWHYDDSGGNWCELRFIDETGALCANGADVDGRAVLIGHDHEYSNTYFGKAAEYFQEDETDILAGVPDWWARPVREFLERSTDWVGFAYGFDGREWRQAEYEPDDGFGSVGLPANSVEETHESIVGLVEHDGGEAPLAAVDALIACDGAVDPEHVAAVFGTLGWDAAAGAAAARRFRQT